MTKHKNYAIHTIALAMAGAACCLILPHAAYGQINLVQNGDMEGATPDFASSWFRSNNGFEFAYPGVDASSGTQSIGFDTTGILADQFTDTTWADLRSVAFRVEPGEPLTWKFSYQLETAPGADPNGELRAELRAWSGFNDETGVVNTFQNGGTHVLLLNSTGASTPDNDVLSVPRNDGSGWIDVSYEMTVPDADVVAYDLRYNNIFTTITIPFEGNFRLDDVQVLREVAGIGGDYNNDGIVDLADYTIWRNQLGAFGDPGEVLGDGDDGSGTGTPDGVVDISDYSFWKSQYGTAAPVATLLGPAVGTAAVPEPSSLLLAAMLAAGVTGICRRK